MKMSRPVCAEVRDLDYCCHFIGRSGVEGIRLFAAADDAAAVLEAQEHLDERAGTQCVELWKEGRLIARCPGAL